MAIVFLPDTAPWFLGTGGKSTEFWLHFQQVHNQVKLQTSTLQPERTLLLAWELCFLEL